MSIRKTIEKLSRQNKCLDNKIKNGDSQNTSNKANSDASNLDDNNIIKWKEKLNLGEEDTLQSITDRDNSTTNFIQLKREEISNTGVNSFSTLNLSIPGYYDKPNLLFTNVETDKFLEKNTKDAWNYNTIVGYDNATNLSNSGSNTIFGYGTMINTDGVDYVYKGNTFIGCYNISKASELYTNIVIGSYNSIFNKTIKTTPYTDYYPIWGNLINGDASNNAWGHLYKWDATRYKNYLRNSIELIDDEGKIGPFNNVFIGNRLKLGLTSNACNSYQSIWIGNNVLNSYFGYNFVGNIFMGNEIYAGHFHDRPAGAVVIGNYLTITDRYTLGELAIHNSTHQPTNWNDALIRGNFNTRYLKINGKFIINPQYAEPFNSEVFTKQVVAKPDGTTTLVDLPTQPQVKILREDYTPTENLEYLDTFTFNLKANTTYKLELGLFGDERILSKCIVTDDIGYLSVTSKYLIGRNGEWNLIIGTEEELQQRGAFNAGLPFKNVATILNYVIRPKSNCTIRIPVKRFSNVSTTDKLLAGTYMKVEPII